MIYLAACWLYIKARANASTQEQADLTLELSPVAHMMTFRHVLGELEQQILEAYTKDVHCRIYLASCGALREISNLRA